MIDILYWALFGLAIVGWLAWVLAVFFGGGILGYTRNSTEATPTDKRGRH